MLHTRGEGHHSEVVGVGNGVDVASEAEGVLGERDALGKATASGRALHAHGGAARRLADGGGGQLAAAAKALHQTDGGGGLAFAQRSGGDGGNVDVLTVGLVGQTLQHSAVIDLAHVVAVGEQFAFLKAQLLAELVHRLHGFFGILGDFPVRVLLRIESHIRTP